MFIQRVNIFLLSLVLSFAPMAAWSIDPITPAFTTAAIASDIAPSLGVGTGGGWGASAAGVASATAAVGVMAASFCIASAIQGTDSCNAASPICKALKSIGVLDCNPSNGSFMRPKTANGGGPCEALSTYISLKTYMETNAPGDTKRVMKVSCTGNANSTPTTVCYTVWSELSTNGGLTFGGKEFVQAGCEPMPADLRPTPVPPNEVGGAIAGSPGAASQLGSAARAYANALGAAGNGCAGAYGYVNNVETCVSDANKAAAAAAAAAAANPPATRTCEAGFTLDPASKICTNDGLSTPNTCGKGQVKGAGGACVPADPLDPTKPAAAGALPGFCTWAETVCDVIKWVKEEPKPPSDDSKLTIKKQGITDTDLATFDINQRRVSFLNQCPTDIDFSFDFMGHSQPLSYKFEPFCSFLEKIRPLIIASSYIAGAYIVAGATRRGGD